MYLAYKKYGIKIADQTGQIFRVALSPALGANLIKLFGGESVMNPAVIVGMIPVAFCGLIALAAASGM